MKKYTIIPVFLLSAVLSLKAQDNAAVSSIAAAAGPEINGNETSGTEVLRTASIDDVLAAVREHNPELAAITQDTEAQSEKRKYPRRPEHRIQFILQQRDHRAIRLGNGRIAGIRLSYRLCSQAQEKRTFQDSSGKQPE